MFNYLLTSQESKLLKDKSFSGTSQTLAIHNVTYLSVYVNWTRKCSVFEIRKDTLNTSKDRGPQFLCNYWRKAKNLPMCSKYVQSLNGRNEQSCKTKTETNFLKKWSVSGWGTGSKYKLNYTHIVLPESRKAINDPPGQITMIEQSVSPGRGSPRAKYL